MALDMIEPVKVGRGIVKMKTAVRNRCKDCYQIGNYIYAGPDKKINVVIPKNEHLTDDKIASDLNYLIEFYGADYANFFLECCSEHIENCKK